jgi:hypothetical protein
MNKRKVAPHVNRTINECTFGELVFVVVEIQIMILDSWFWGAFWWAFRGKLSKFLGEFPL